MPLRALRTPPDNGQPVYRRIADDLRMRIESGDLAPGERLPTIRALATELGVNRDTAALAYEALAAAGLVESTVGRGTFVRDDARGAPVAPAASFDPVFTPTVERMLDHDRARPRYAAPAGAVPLHSLVPDPALYPVDEFRRVLARALLDGGPDLLGYAGAHGHTGLREQLARRLRDAGVGGADVGPESIALTQGASEGISIALRLFAEPGDAVAVEEPTYHNVLSALIALGLRPVPVPMRDGAPDLGVLARALARSDVKLFYTMPTFHNPMGTTTPLAHRRELVRIAAAAGKPVIEDAYETDLRFAGRAVPALAALDERGLVLQLFSFSKSLFPGARVGCITARGRVIDAVVALKHATDLGGALALQAALAAFVASGGYDRHLARVRRVLRRRRDAMLEALAKGLPEGSRWTTPEGGLQLWVDLPGGLDTAELLPDAVRAGVLFAPGFQFRHDRRPSSGMRLSFAQSDEAAIARGIAALGRVTKERLRGSAREAGVAGEAVNV
jgi:DNA-binding transcriptional MocR family regulator